MPYPIGQRYANTRATYRFPIERVRQSASRLLAHRLFPIAEGSAAVFHYSSVGPAIHADGSGFVGRSKAMARPSSRSRLQLSMTVLALLGLLLTLATSFGSAMSGGGIR